MGTLSLKELVFKNAAFRKLPFMSRVKKREFQCGLQVRVLKPSLCAAKKLKQKFCIVLSNFSPKSSSTFDKVSELEKLL